MEVTTRSANGESEGDRNVEVTQNDLIDFVLDRESDEQRERIRRALAIPGSYASQWMRNARESLSINPLSANAPLPSWVAKPHASVQDDA